MESKPKWAVIIVGPPGSGKDTQAELLAHELGYEQIKSSVVIQKKFAEADPNDAVMNREKEINRSGGLNSSELVMQWLAEEITRVGGDGKGLILTGGLRRESEAEVTMATLAKYYEPAAIKIVSITVSSESTLFRNTGRRICQLNQHPVPNIDENKHLTACPLDGSPIITREDDDPETIKKRSKLYHSEQAPILDFLTQKGYNVVTIDGEQSIEDVHRSILNKLW